jgi:hypothetical protein
MAALCGLGNMEGLIDKVCVARDEVVGVYGFVFHRGESISMSNWLGIIWNFLAYYGLYYPSPISGLSSPRLTYSRW